MAILVHGREHALALRNMLAKEHLGLMHLPIRMILIMYLMLFEMWQLKMDCQSMKAQLLAILVKHRVYEDIYSKVSGSLSSLISHYFRSIFSYKLTLSLF
jgi:hypothetical protein